jgi:DNA polymerase-3 subunit epsilon
MSRTLAFVDLETTGATAQSDRITEVGIVEVAESGITEWSCLVDPQTRISDFIVRLTGISNEMVAGAPRFKDIAAELLARLQGRLFIAHNARFDYGFLKAEFKRAGLEFRTQVLCTVKLSRRLYPQHERHNLDALVARHGLEVGQRHRALGDARLIHQFWCRVNAEHPAPLVEASVAALTARPSLPIHLDASLPDDLPPGHGVYLFFGENNLPLYVGKSVNLRKRVLAHFAADHQAAKEMALAQQVRRVDWRQTHGELGSLLLESALVKQLMPMHNRRLRRNSEFCLWRLLEQPDGALRPELVRATDLSPGALDGLYGLFRSERKAHQALQDLADEHGLCHGSLGLQRSAPGHPCFARQLGRCFGACTGAEPVTTHNRRLLEALAVHQFPRWPHAGPIGVREGPELHVLDDWCHLGTARSENEVFDLLENARPVLDPDIYLILRKCLPRARTVALGEARSPHPPRTHAIALGGPETESL